MSGDDGVIRRLVQRIVVLVVMLASVSASAERRLNDLSNEPAARVYFRPHLHRQVQADLGLTVIQLAYEEPLDEHWALQIEGGIFGTYFLPWFDLGDDVKGIGGGTRVTWFARASGHGPYVAPYLRVSMISGEDPAGVERTGIGLATGVFAGWAFGLTARLDLRIGIGAQYIYLNAPPLGASTPFVALDLVVGYRL